MCHVSRPSHISWFGHPKYIWWRVKIITSSLCNLLLFLFTSSLSAPNIFLNILFSKNLSLCSILSMTDQVSQKNKRTGKMEYGFDSLVYHTVTFLFFPTPDIFCSWRSRFWCVCDETVGVTQDLWLDCGCDTGLVMRLWVWQRICD